MLVALAGLDRLATPGAMSLEAVIDPAINIFGLLGLIAVSIRTVLLPLRGSVRMLRVLLGGFLGPLLALVAVSGVSPDVDGGLWMIFAPVLGVVLVGLALVVRGVAGIVHARVRGCERTTGGQSSL